MYVCLCRAVTSRTITEVIRAGAGTVEEVGARCAAGTHCGKCRETIERLIDQYGLNGGASCAGARGSSSS